MSNSSIFQQDIYLEHGGVRLCSITVAWQEKLTILAAAPGLWIVGPKLL
jgi:hypothetical protein